MKDQKKRLDDFTFHPFPQQVQGYFRRLKAKVSIILLSVYYLVPWLRWDRGEGVPNQLFLFDIAHRRGYLFDIYIWPQQTFLFAFVLLLFGVGLFLSSALFGRLWCGFACPQTVFTDLFMGIERRLEGRRLFSSGMPFTLGAFLRRLSKHVLWLGISFWTSWTWLAYFNGATKLWPLILSGTAGFWIYSFLFGITALFYLTAGFLRERLCVYMCPYSRFQSALQDDHTRILAYQVHRGEPRGKPKENKGGDCIDCRLCYRVCPTGVDIRKGFNLACISCGLCIDACDGVMGKLKKPKGLIAFQSSLQMRVAAEGGQPPKSRLFRFRTMVYLALMGVLLGTLFYFWHVVTPVDISFNHVRSPLVSTLADGRQRNTYQVHVLNKSPQSRRYGLSLPPQLVSAFSLASERTPFLSFKKNVLFIQVPPQEDVFFRLHILSNFPLEHDEKRIELIFEEKGGHLYRKSFFLSFYGKTNR